MKYQAINRRARLGTALAALAIALDTVSAAAPAIAQPTSAKPAETLTLSKNTGTLVRLSEPMSDVFVANDTIADVQVRSSTQLYVFGKGAGETTIYATSKGGLQMLTRALAVELAPFNVQVNGIAPGFFKTEMNTALIADAKFSAWVASRTPAGRWGEPPEIAGAAVFLASGAADYVTGHVLFVDGGFSVAY